MIPGRRPTNIHFIAAAYVRPAHRERRGIGEVPKRKLWLVANLNVCVAAHVTLREKRG